MTQTLVEPYELYIQHMQLADFLAERLCRLLMDKRHLRQMKAAAHLALLRACHVFDQESGKSIGVWASPRINDAIVDVLPVRLLAKLPPFVRRGAVAVARSA
jgi:DNA-directed RNA polymerase specialized sigma subunit